MKDQFEKDVIDGLSATPKYLPSRYFYDKDGDRLFQKIMDLEEYYLTRSELEVLQDNRKDIFQAVAGSSGQRFNLFEFGAGDGLKTKILLHYFLESEADFTYKPIDISGNAISGLTNNLRDELPELDVQGIQNEYFKALEHLDQEHEKSVVLFLGSNIGNFTIPRARNFLGQLFGLLQDGDMVLIGFDLKKDPNKIRQAYDDREGVTAEFNMNLLKRINRELNADFNLDHFMHYPLYEPVSGEARSYLVSTKDQLVTIGSKTVKFRAWETIHTEISRKFDPVETDDLARAAGFKVEAHFFDSDRNFMDVLWKK